MQLLHRPCLSFAPAFHAGACLAREFLARGVFARAFPTRALLAGALLSGALLAGAAPPARADMRCAPHLVAMGLTIPEVLERCGQPVFEYHRMETIAPDVWVAVDELIYEQGGNKFRRLLRFENGRLQNIEVLRKPVVPMTGTAASDG